MMKKTIRTDYKICPFCGASLDVGERCDCNERAEGSTRPIKDSEPYKITLINYRPLKSIVEA